MTSARTIAAIAAALVAMSCHSDRSPSRVGDIVVEPDPVPASPFSEFGFTGDIKPVVAKRYLSRAMTNIHHCGRLDNPLSISVAINRRGDALDARAKGDAPAFAKRCVANLLRAMRYPGTKDGKPIFMAATLKPTTGINPRAVPPKKPLPAKTAPTGGNAVPAKPAAPAKPNR